MMTFLGYSFNLSRSIRVLAFLIPANLIFLIRFDRKKHFFIKFLLSFLFAAILLARVFVLTRNTWSHDIVGFVIALTYTVLMAKLCFRISWIDSIFCATAGYGTQFLASIIDEFIERMSGIVHKPILHCIMIAVAVYAAAYLLLGRQIRKGQNLDLNKMLHFILLSAAVMIEIVLCGLMRAYWTLPANRVITACSMILLFISTVALLELQFSLLRYKSLARDYDILNQLLRKEQSHYKLSKNIINSINQKCHDMRHQIHVIGTNERINTKALEEMNSALDVYDIICKTGNTALDVILSEKIIYCKANHIILTCMADGEKLDFMSETDIYSLLGNILENAINAVSELSEEQRSIELTIATRDSLLSISTRNAYAGVITMDGDLPVTQSSDTENHGIGTKSIQMIVQKYGGVVNFLANDGTFIVNILFPL